LDATQRFSRPRVLIAVPSSLTPVERRAVQEAASSAGSKQVSLVDAPLAAAVGASLPIEDALGSMDVDVEGATSERAMIALREVLSELVRSIVESTRDCLAESPSELAHDVLETGLFLSGGGGLLTGLDMRLAQECEVPVHLTDDPLRTCAIGVGRLLDVLPDE